MPSGAKENLVNDLIRANKMKFPMPNENIAKIFWENASDVAKLIISCSSAIPVITWVIYLHFIPNGSLLVQPFYLLQN